MDPLGFGLRTTCARKWRTTMAIFRWMPAALCLMERPFSSPAEMRALLISQLPNSPLPDRKDAHLFVGRGLERSDRLAVDDLNKKLAASEYRFQTLIYEIVKSLPFQSRGPKKPLDVARRIAMIITRKALDRERF